MEVRRCFQKVGRPERRKGMRERAHLRIQARKQSSIRQEFLSTKKKQSLVTAFGSVVRPWLVTSKHKTQEGLNIVQMGHCLAAPKYTVQVPNTSKQTQESIIS